MIEPSTSSHSAPTSRASCAWRRMPGGLRRITVQTRRISSWVLRSGECSESIWLSHELCASCSAGKTWWSGSSNGKLQSLLGLTGASRAGRGPELDDRDVLARRVEHGLERHPHLERVELAVHDVRHHAGTLFEL